MDWHAVRRAVLGGLVAFGMVAGTVLTPPTTAAFAQEGEIDYDPGGPYGGNGEGPSPGGDIFMCIFFGMECPSDPYPGY